MFSKVEYVRVDVSDMRRSVAFNRDTLGLKFESPRWSEFETGAATLALHAGTRAAKPRPGPAAGWDVFAGFSVPDLNTTYAKLRERGAHLDEVAVGASVATVRAQQLVHRLCFSK